MACACRLATVAHSRCHEPCLGLGGGLSGSEGSSSGGGDVQERAGHQSEAGRRLGPTRTLGVPAVSHLFHHFFSSSPHGAGNLTSGLCRENYEEASKFFKSAVEANAHASSYYYHLGRAYWQMGGTDFRSINMLRATGKLIARSSRSTACRRVPFKQAVRAVPVPAVRQVGPDVPGQLHLSRPLLPLCRGRPGEGQAMLPEGPLLERLARQRGRHRLEVVPLFFSCALHIPTFR